MPDRVIPAAEECRRTAAMLVAISAYAAAFMFVCASDAAHSAQITEEYVVISAEGAAGNPAMSEAQQRKSAAETAYYAALQKLAEYIAGVDIRGSVRIGNNRLSGGNVIELVQAELRGVEEISCEFTVMEDGSILARSTVRIPAAEKERIAGMMRAGVLQDAAGIGEFPGVFQRNPAGNRITGVIIDVRMRAPDGWIPPYPAVRSVSGAVIYHPVRLQHESILKRLPAGYAASLDGARTDIDRIGANPVLIQAVGVGFDNGGVIIISDRDADALARIPDINILFETGSILFIL